MALFRKSTRAASAIAATDVELLVIKALNDFMAREFWRFVLVQDRVAELARTAIDYPPMQDPASFNLDAAKRQIEATIKEHACQ